MHRWYDPGTGRWISEDPIGFAAGDANLYRYVGNGVTGATDPQGLKKYPTDLDYEDADALYIALLDWTSAVHASSFLANVPPLTLYLLDHYLKGSGKPVAVDYRKYHFGASNEVVREDLNAVRAAVNLLLGGPEGWAKMNGDIVYDVVQAHGGSYSFEEGDLKTAIGGVHSWRYHVVDIRRSQEGFACYISGTLRADLRDTYDFHDNGKPATFPHLARFSKGTLQAWWPDDNVITAAWMKDLADHGLAKVFDVSATWTVKFKVYTQLDSNNVDWRSITWEIE